MDENPVTAPAQTTTEDKPLNYEETPVIEPVEQNQEPVSPPDEPVAPPPPIESGQAPPPAAPVKHRTSFLGIIGNLLLFAVLFGVGMWLASFLRQYLPSGTQETEPPLARKETSVIREPTGPPDPYEDWVSHQVISSATKQPIPGIQFKLPQDVLSPICDGATCMSQGTYLPGGTRFTIAARGPGLALRDFRGRVISDVNGMEFTTEPTTVVGRNALKFTGNFSGRTVAGYAFTRMHGYMVEVTDTLSLEVNHFIPAGITADFESDHTLFESIVKSLTLEGYPVGTQKGAAIPTVQPTATSSGY